MSFNAKLGRLKQALAVVEDQAVAEALGMSPAALSVRKRRGSFPDDKVFVLASSRPDLAINVEYVLTGQGIPAIPTTPSTSAFVGELMRGAVDRSDALLQQSALNILRDEGLELLAALQHPNIRLLLGLLAFCDDKVIDELTRLAFARRMDQPVPFSDRRSPVTPSNREAGLASRDEGTVAGIALDEFHRSPNQPGAGRSLAKLPAVEFGMTATPLAAPRKSKSANALTKRGKSKASSS